MMNDAQTTAVLERVACALEALAAPAAPSPPLTYSITEAAERIGHLVTVDYLRKHIKELPHCKSGEGVGRAGRIAFTELHLAEIVQRLEQRPAATPNPSGPESFSSLRIGRRGSG